MNYIDIIIIGFLVISMSLFLYVLLSSGNYKVSDREKNIRDKAIKKRNNWLKSSIISIGFYYWCILCSIFSTLIVLHIGCYGDIQNLDDKIRLVLLSIVSIFTNVCPYMIDLKKMSKAYRKAFCIIEEAILKDKGFVDAMTKGEKEISIVFE